MSRRFVPWFVGLIVLAAVTIAAVAAQASVSSPTTVYSSNGCTVQEYRAAKNDSTPNRIIAAPDGYHWFTEERESLGRIAVVYPNRTIVQFPIPTLHGLPYGIAIGPDGTVWFTEAQASKIGRLSKSRVFTEYPLPPPPIVAQTGTRSPTGIVRGPDNNMWFTEAAIGWIGRISPDGVLKEFKPGFGGPVYITVGPDGALWFTDSLDVVGRITTSGKITHFRLPPKSGPMGITSGPDGALWFTEYDRDRIGRITVNGVISHFSLPPGSVPGFPMDIASNGVSIWFTEPNRSSVARISTAGLITEVPLHSGVGPSGITVDRDGEVWFTENNANRIGVLKCL